MSTVSSSSPSSVSRSTGVVRAVPAAVLSNQQARLDRSPAAAKRPQRRRVSECAEGAIQQAKQEQTDADASAQQEYVDVALFPLSSSVPSLSSRSSLVRCCGRVSVSSAAAASDQVEAHAGVAVPAVSPDGHWACTLEGVDGASRLSVAVPLSILLPSMPLALQQLIAARWRQGDPTADILAQMLAADSPVREWLPSGGCGLELTGVLQQATRDSTRRLFATQLLTICRLSAPAAADGDHHHTADSVSVMLVAFDQETLALRHLQQTGSSAGSTPKTPPKQARVAPAASPFVGTVTRASPPRHRCSPPAHLRSYSSAGSSHPRASPLPLPVSLFDEFASSQEEQAHVAMADMAIKSFQAQHLQRLPPPHSPAAAAFPSPMQPQSHAINARPMPGAAMHTPARPTNGWAQPQQKSAARAPVPPFTPRPNAQATPMQAAPNDQTFVHQQAAAGFSSRPTTPAAFNTPRPFSAPKTPSSMAAAAPEPLLPAPSEPELLGFTTGRGKTVTPSAAAMQAAIQRMEAAAAEDASAAPLFDGDRPSSPSHAPGFDANSFLPSFSTGRGKKVAISEAAAARANKMMEEIVMEEGAGAPPANGSASDGAPAAAASSSSVDWSTMGGFQTGRGKSITADPTALEAAAARFKQWQSDAEGEDGSAAIAAASSTAAAASSRTLSPSHASDFDADTYMPAFSTGSGKAVVISEAAKAKGKKFMESVDADLATEAPIAAASNLALPTSRSPRPPSPSSDPHFDASSYMPSFSTGLGRKVAPSEQALKQAEMMMEKERLEFEKQHGTVPPLAAAAASVPSSAASPAAAATPQMGGFSSKKPFKPPAMTRPPATRTAAISPAAPIPPPTAAASILKPASAVAPARVSKLDLLDAQIAAMESGVDVVADSASADAAAYGLLPASAAAVSGFSSAGASFKSAGPTTTAAPPSAPTASSSVAETAAQRIARVQKELMDDLGMTDMDESIDFAVGKTHDADAPDEKMDTDGGFQMGGFSKAGAGGFQMGGFGKASSDIQTGGFGKASGGFQTAKPNGFSSAGGFAKAGASSFASGDRFSSAKEISAESEADTAPGFTTAGQKRKALSQVVEEDAPQHQSPVPTANAPGGFAAASSSPSANLPSRSSTAATPAYRSSNVVPSTTGSSLPSLSPPAASLASTPAAATALPSITPGSDAAAIAWNPWMKRPRLHEPTSAVETVATPTAVISTAVQVAGPTPIPIASFDSPSTPPRGAPAASNTNTPQSHPAQVSPSQAVVIPATPSLESQPGVSLEMQFDEAAMEDGPSKQAEKKSTGLPIHLNDEDDDFLPPPSFHSQRQHLMDGITTFASQL